MWLSVSLILASTGGCGSTDEVDPVDTPTGRLCADVYASTVKLLTEQFARAGTHFPDWPDRRSYIVKCIDLDLTEEQIRCLDPEWSRGDPQGCSHAMESEKRGADELSKWFTDEVKKGLVRSPAEPEE